MTSTTQIPFIDLASRDLSTRSPKVLAARDANWCARTPFGLAILRYDQAARLLRDRRLRQGSHAWPRLNHLSGSFAEFWQRSIISQEGPPHRTLRHVAVGALSPEFINTLQPAFDGAAISLANELRNHSPVEFMSAFALPFAGHAICILLGLPASRWPQLASDASDLGLAMGVDGQQYQSRFNAACDRLMNVAQELVDRVNDGQDSESYAARLSTRFADSGTRDPQMLLDLLVISIFGAVDTTRAQLGNAMSLFANHPQQWQLLRKDKSLIPQAIEEVIRQRPTTTWVTREALEDFEYEGQPITRGETVHLLVHSASVDPAIAPQPDFDILAKRKPHIGFGGGAHHCLGHMVARTDMASAIAALVDTIETFKLSGTDEWLPDSGNTGAIKLPLTMQFA